MELNQKVTELESLRVWHVCCLCDGA
jgi:hypothetical protein